MNLRKRAPGDSYIASLIILSYLEYFKEKPRKRVIGDLYLASSIIFIYLAFLYFGFQGKGLTFLVVGLIIGFLGMKTKKVMMEQEEKFNPRKKQYSKLF